VGHAELIKFNEQSKVWAHERPVLFIFGTAKGLAPQVIERSDYLLLPVQGFSDFNHLSVRSAIAIILDRWLGINLD
jgi:tRNA (guanine37-N1)-methyltransferase